MLIDTLKSRSKPSRTVLVNGDLVVHCFPKQVSNPVGLFLVYRIVDDQAWFWSLHKEQVKAVTISGSVGGHVIRIKDIYY